MSEFSEMYNECPKCDNELHVESCHGLGCEDGYWEDDDGINGSMQIRCDECCGTGTISWCKECGWDARHKQFLSPKYEEEYLAKQKTAEVELMENFKNQKIYIASKTKHAAKWRKLRSEGWNITATWIDEAGAGESKDLKDLAIRCINEAKTADKVILYSDNDELLKGALMEVGAALANNIRVYVVGWSPSFETALNNHPLWIDAVSLSYALHA